MQPFALKCVSLSASRFSTGRLKRLRRIIIIIIIIHLYSAFATRFKGAVYKKLDISKK